MAPGSASRDAGNTSSAHEYIWRLHFYVSRGGRRSGGAGGQEQRRRVIKSVCFMSVFLEETACSKNQLCIFTMCTTVSAAAASRCDSLASRGHFTRLQPADSRLRSQAGLHILTSLLQVYSHCDDQPDSVTVEEVTVAPWWWVLV